ncbi:CASP-like protein 5B3 [Asparagus officinalis]|uniref:CASP-like protein 5B3 n=1 Tax=Asparagus officinalis TaxID=4686 RepID=UPI00098E8065|nr:CASP-like protein 5B3 [Asparagus officinalis]
MAPRMLGRPGTITSLMLRIPAFLLAAASLVCTLFVPQYSGTSAYRALYFTMGTSTAWSLGLLVYDLYAVILGGPCASIPVITTVMVGDWIVGGLTLAGAMSSAGVTFLLGPNFRICHFVPAQCHLATASIVLAFGAWVAIAISALLTFSVRCDPERL